MSSTNNNICPGKSSFSINTTKLELKEKQQACPDCDAKNKNYGEVKLETVLDTTGQMIPERELGIKIELNDEQLLIEDEGAERDTRKNSFSINTTKLKFKDEQQASLDCDVKNYAEVKLETVLDATGQMIPERELGIKMELTELLIEDEEAKCDISEYKCFVLQEQQIEQDREQLYSGHEIKDEMVVGPVVLRQTGAGTGLLASDIGVGSGCAQAAIDGSEQCRAAPETGGAGDVRRPSCGLCSRQCISKNYSTVYMSTQTGERQYYCDICSRSFKQKQDLKNYIQSHAQTKNFTNASQLKTYTWTPVVDEPYGNDLCDKRYIKERKLSKHMRKRVGDKPFSCNVCNKKIIESSNLTKHMRIHTVEKPYGCDICSKSFTVKSNLTIHMRKHTGDKPYGCNICSKKFTLNCNLTSHMRTHTGDKPYSCDICNKKFSNSSTLRNHMQTHTGNKAYGCEICNKMFSRRYHLSVHMRTHTGDKPYCCDICEKLFSQSSSLTSHMRMHTGDKPHSCDICSKQFSRNGSLSRHMRTHTDDKTYGRNVCTKKITNRSYLSKHMQTHTGDKPYGCNICYIFFSRIGDLSLHMRITHS